MWEAVQDRSPPQTIKTLRKTRIATFMSSTNTNRTLFIDLFLSEELYDEFCEEDPPDEIDEREEELAHERWEQFLDEYEGFIHVHFGADLTKEIQSSMGGKRHLVHLHRLKPLPAYALETEYHFYDQGLTGGSRFTRREVLACLQYELKRVLGSPRGPVFYGTYTQARGIVEDARNHLIRWRRGVQQEAEMLAHQEEATEHSPSVKEGESFYDRQSDPDAVGSRAWWAALKIDIARCREDGDRHSRRICDVLDGLHGKKWQKWLERELETTPGDEDSIPKPASDAQKLRCVTCGHSFAPDTVAQHSWVKCPECGFNSPRDARFAK